MDSSRIWNIDDRKMHLVVLLSIQFREFQNPNCINLILIGYEEFIDNKSKQVREL